MNRLLYTFFAVTIISSMLMADSSKWMRPFFEFESKAKESRYLFQNIDIKFDSVNRKITRSEQMIYFGNNNDLGNELPMRFHYDDKTKISDIEIYYKLPGKKAKRVKSKELKESEGIGRFLYSDSKFLSWDTDILVPGSILGIGCTYTTHNPQYSSRIILQDSYPINVLQLTITYPGWPSTFTLLNDNINTGLSSEIIPQDNGQLFIELSDVPKVKRYEQQRLPQNDLPILFYQVGLDKDLNNPNNAHTNWESLGRAIDNYYYNEEIDFHDGINSTVDELTIGMTSDLDKINAITLWIQENIRYIAVEIGEGGFRPYPADQTFLNKYGDCKDKATLLNTMLSYVGIDSKPVLIHTRGDWLVNEQFPSSQFNHAISAIGVNNVLDRHKFKTGNLIDGEYILFDPTNPIIPFGQLPEYDEDVNVLILDGEDSQLAKSPSRLFNENVQVKNVSFILKNSGELSGKFIFNYIGQFAYELTSILKDEGSFDEIVNDFVLPFFPSSTIHNYNLIDSENEHGNMKLNIDFDCPDNNKFKKKIIPFELKMYKSNSPTFEEGKESNYYFDSPYQLVDTVIVSLDEDYKVIEIPEDIHFINDVGEYHAEFSSQNRKCTMFTSFSVFDRTIQGNKYGQLKELFDIRHSGEKSVLFLEK